MGLEISTNSMSLDTKMELQILIKYQLALWMSMKNTFA